VFYVATLSRRSFNIYNGRSSEKVNPSKAIISGRPLYPVLQKRKPARMNYAPISPKHEAFQEADDYVRIVIGHYRVTMAPAITVALPFVSKVLSGWSKRAKALRVSMLPLPT
jgi:hypothetical protein